MDTSRLMDERVTELVELANKYPTTIFVATRLKEVGWDSEHGQFLLKYFREDLIRESGDNFRERLSFFLG